MMLNNIPNWFLTWPRWLKQALAVVVDTLLCIFSVWVTLSLRLERPVALAALPPVALLVSVGLALPLFVNFGLYRAIFRYAGLYAFTSLGKAMTFYTLVYASIFSIVGVANVPRSVGLSQPMLLFLLVGLSRAAVRYWLGGMYREMLAGKGATRVLVYGAGAAGRQLAAGLSTSKSMRLTGYLDDDERLHGQVLNGIRIYGRRYRNQDHWSASR